MNISKLHQMFKSNHCMFYVRSSLLSSLQIFGIKNWNPSFYAKHVENGYFPLPPSLRCTQINMHPRQKIPNNWTCKDILKSRPYKYTVESWLHPARTCCAWASSQTSSSLENSRFPYVFHQLVVSCKFHSICFAKFVQQIWTSSLHDIFT